MPPRLRLPLCLVLALPAALTALRAQTAPAPTAADDTVTLSPFTVPASDDKGWRASNSIGGTRVNTPLADIPMNIEVVTDAFMHDIAAIDASESLRYQAGVITGLRDGSNDTAVSIRGYSTTWQMRDGFRRYDTSDSVNIERQEVVAGPAAVLYGISQPGGIINYVTKLPLPGQAAEISEMVGSYHLSRTEIDLNDSPGGPLAIRLTAAQTNEGGFRDYEKTDRTFVAPILQYRFDANTTLTLDGEFMYQDRGYTTNKLQDISLSATGVATNLPRFVAVPNAEQWSGPDTDQRNDVTNILAIIDHRFGDSFSINAGFNGLTRTQDIISQTERGFALAALRDANGNLVLDGSGNPIKAVRTVWANDHNSNWMWQFRLDSIYKFDLWGTKNTLLTGLNHSRDTNFRDLFEDRNPNPANGVDILGQNYRYYPVSVRYPDLRIGNPTFNPVVWARPYLNYRDPTVLDSAYVNYQGVYLNHTLFLLAGIRYDRNDYSRHWQWYRTGETDILHSITDKWSPNVGLLYRPISWVSIYGLTAESMQPLNGQTNSFGTPLSPTFGKSLEGGLKFDGLGGRVSGTVSFYTIKNENIAVTNPNILNASGTLGDTVQVGEQTSQGVDFEGFYFPTDQWQINAGWSYDNTWVSKDVNPANIGSNFSGLPYDRGTFFTSYKPLKGLTLGGGAIYTGPFNTGLSYVGGQAVKTSSFTQADAFVRYELAWSQRGRISLALNVLNLTNRLDEGGGPLIQGRTFRLTAGLHF
jgi:outer membrane receptor protein involved in Fe transport